ncbi:NAD(P)H-dependent flavin oxidoreductase [Rugosimonospora africana]|uniref:2-nitropropane dioxygenase n=1 Tax=Rugosimonospora africana TaxID=556532 RepID=A0A8J3QTN6_9ACTN|nr:nitronate monooxygenase [Rugosimonospora africana]GIH15605.1 2-nitropropane dioxygenase [Rugosimonospora africana]
MVLRTEFTRSLSVTHPIVSAPMGGAAGGALAAAVSNAGGLGLVGGGRSDRDWLDRELALVSGLTTKPWGVGFLTWALDPDTLTRALEFRPAAVMLAFGDPAPFADRVRAAGAKLILQVTDPDEARQALDAGADVIVAQGSDAGGHSGRHSVGTMSFVPAVVDLAGSTTVLAAGGIADGRGLAAALMLGAAGALIGTRFQASHEALVSAPVSRALVDARGRDTERSTILDIGRGAAWPERYPARTLRNAFLDAWRDREGELRGDAAAQREYREAIAREDPGAIPIWVSQAADLIGAIEPAADLVAAIAAEAERVLTGAGSR